jgi:hypothetical protein
MSTQIQFKFFEIPHFEFTPNLKMLQLVPLQLPADVPLFSEFLAFGGLKPIVWVFGRRSGSQSVPVVYVMCYPFGKNKEYIKEFLFHSY